MKRFQVNMWLRTKPPCNARVEVEADSPGEAFIRAAVLCILTRPEISPGAIIRKNVKEVRL